jgi:ABC-2 type transport system permease protein
VAGLKCAAALVGAGFRRFATYRQATFAALFTNSVFGFMRCYVMLAVAGAAGAVAGYRGEQLVTFVWLGQGLLGVIAIWGWTDLADRVRTGDVAADLLRPINPLWTYLFTDLGRGLHAMLTRMIGPIVVGALAFHMYVPKSLWTYPAFLLSTMLAIVVSFGCRYLVNLTAFWLLDNRGVQTAWALMSGLFCGLTMPIGFFPVWAQNVLWLTPFPAIMQVPLDTALERRGTAVSLGLIGSQVVWIAMLLALCLLVQRRAVRRLVVQGG